MRCGVAYGLQLNTTVLLRFYSCNTFRIAILCEYLEVNAQSRNHFS